MTEIVTMCVACCLAIISSLVYFVITKINTDRMKIQLNGIEEMINTSGENFYVICPNCGQKIYLRTTQIFIEQEKKQ